MCKDATRGQDLDNVQYNLIYYPPENKDSHSGFKQHDLAYLATFSATSSQPQGQNEKKSMNNTLEQPFNLFDPTIIRTKTSIRSRNSLDCVQTI